MAATPTLPAALAACAERRTWFSRTNCERVLDWIEQSGLRFLGLDVAERQTDGKWMLLISPILDLSKEVDQTRAVRFGREFLAANDTETRMFEPVWQGRNV